MQAHQRLSTDVFEASRAAIQVEAGTLRDALRQQAEGVAGELERMRQTSSERADCLSRYIDDAVARGGGGDGRSGRQAAPEAPPPALADLSERLAALRAALDTQGELLGRRLEATTEDFRARLRRAEEARVREMAVLRKVAEGAAAGAERRSTAAQEELRGRFEAYVRHFDSAVGSLQAAVLRPPPIRGGIAAPARNIAVGPAPEPAAGSRPPPRPWASGSPDGAAAGRPAAEVGAEIPWRQGAVTAGADAEADSDAEWRALDADGFGFVEEHNAEAEVDIPTLPPTCPAPTETGESVGGLETQAHPEAPPLDDESQAAPEEKHVEEAADRGRPPDGDGTDGGGLVHT